MADQQKKFTRTIISMHLRLPLFIIFLWRAIIIISVSATTSTSHQIVDPGTSYYALDHIKSTTSRNTHSIQTMATMKRTLFANINRVSLRAPTTTAGRTMVGQGGPLFVRSYHRTERNNMAFASLSNMQHLTINFQRLTQSSSSRPPFQSLPRRAFFHSCPRYSSILSSSKSSTSQTNNNYYAAATQMSTLSKSDSSSSPQPPDESYPDWWPISNSLEKHIAFADHIVHVIVPNVTDDAEGDGIVGKNKEINATLTCNEVIQWVLKAAKDRNKLNNNVDPDDAVAEGGINPDYESRQLRIETEWTEGETVSRSFTVLDPAYRHDPSLFPQDVSINMQPNLLAAELLALGSVWHLPYLSSTGNKPTMDRFDPSNGVKPTRLNIGDGNTTANAGDYFRVHFDPRRFLDTNFYDWGTADGSSGGESDKPGVIVSRDDKAGYIIINKPSNIPVHARVDNSLENVAASVGRTLWTEQRESILLSVGDGKKEDNDELLLDDDSSGLSKAAIKYKRRKNNRKQKKEQLIYVATPQRLDQNTSGLLVVATNKPFAAYFAKLLRTKTSGQLKHGGSSRSASCGVHKTYRCLVCITPQSGSGGAAATASMASEIDRLKQYTTSIMKHFLEPSIRAPKRFTRTVPDDADNSESWAECLLRITNISEVYTVVGNAPSDALAKALFGDYGKPDGCIAVAECEIELLTGRTHQIRGQLAAEGFPLVGDVQYGGAVPNTSSLYKERCKGRAESFLDSELLALQCSSLEFLDPQHNMTSDGLEKKKMKRSETWKSFRLDTAFWTPFVARYSADTATLASSEATSSLIAETPLLKQASHVSALHDVYATTHGLPPRVLLSEGRNKYIVIRASLPEGSGDDSEEWFVRSASPEECGGPYHVNVAENVLTQLQSLGYTTSVVGGGRIDFVQNEEVSLAHVFGFSYGFGKGDHEKVASIIEANTDIIATFDSSDGLY